jgi:hypothetical protein
MFDSFERYWSNQDTPTVLEFNNIFKSFQIMFELRLLQQQNVLLRNEIKAKLE